VSTGSDGRHALVVATGHYRDPKLQQLRAPAADAERLAEVLRDPAKGNFDVEVLADERYAMLTRRIAGFFRDRRPNDLLLLHFSCHGVKDDRGDLYLAATDTELDLLSATAVSAAWLNDQISRTRSRRTVVLLDCCFSGSFPFGMRARAGTAANAPDQFEGRGRAIITASSGMEYAYEGDHLTGEGQPSVFTEAVVEGLETGKADLDHDQLVSVDDLYGYVYDRVKESTPSQTPNKKSEIEGPLYLARSTYRPQVRPATLDAELVARTEDRYAGIRAGAVQELGYLLTSRDPTVALAAREALSRLKNDDSRQVSASAHAALAVAEQTEREGAEAERPEREPEPAERDRAERARADTERARAEPAGVREETSVPAVDATPEARWGPATDPPGIASGDLGGGVSSSVSIAPEDGSTTPTTPTPAAKPQPTQGARSGDAASQPRRLIAAACVALTALLIAGAVVAIVAGGGGSGKSSSGTSSVTVISQNPTPALILPPVHGLTAVDARETDAPGGYRYRLVLSKVKRPGGASVTTPVTYYFTLSVRRGRQPFVVVHQLKLPYPFTADSVIADFTIDSNPDGTANAMLSWFLKNGDRSDLTHYFSLTPQEIGID
jgi:Caspase domain